MKNLLLSVLIGIALTTTVFAIEPNQEPPCCDMEEKKEIVPEVPSEFVIMRPMTCKPINAMVSWLRDELGEIPFVSGDAFLITREGGTLPLQIMWSMNPQTSRFTLIELHYTTGMACLLGSGKGMEMHIPKNSKTKVEVLLDNGI